MSLKVDFPAVTAIDRFTVSHGAQGFRRFVSQFTQR
jgi:hypothetical protein